MNGLVGQRRNIFRPRFWRMLRDIQRFYREAPDFLCSNSDNAYTIGAFLENYNYSESFINDHLIPMGAAIWSTTVEEMKNYPVNAFIRFFLSHGLLNITNRPVWRTVRGGSKEYVRRLTESYKHNIRFEKVLRISRKSDCVEIKDILKNCILTKGVKVDELPTFDIEYLFLNIRSRSIGESIELVVTCPDDGETKVNTTIYIDEIEVKKNKEHSTDIKIDDTYTMRMKYPSLDEFIDENFNFEGQSDNSFDIIASCIDMVFSEEEAWEAKDCTKKELIEFVEQMNSAQFKQIENFFDTMPQLSHEIEVVNPKTKVKSTVILEGLASFFG